METRSQDYFCTRFENVEDINDNVLPTYEYVTKYYDWNREQLKITRNTTKEPSFLDIAKLVAQRIECVWRKSSLPTVSNTIVIQVINGYHINYKNLIKSLKKMSVY